MNDNKIYKIGLFGASNILDNIMGDVFVRHPNFTISGLSSNSHKKKERIAENLNCDTFSSYDELINNDKIDIGYVSLANIDHFRIAKKLLINKIHCLIEKPLCCSVEDCKELTHIAKKNNLVLMETFQFQFHSQFKYIKDLIKNNKLGSIRSVNVKFGFPPRQNPKDIRYQKSLKGGSFFDAGVYISKIATLLFDTTNSEVLSSISNIEGFEVDIYGSCMIKTICKNTIFGSWGFDNHYSCSLEIWFSNGRIKANRIFTSKKGYNAKIIVENKDKTFEKSFIDDQYFNMLNELYLTVSSDKKKEENYIANLKQVELMKKIFP